MPRLSSFKLKVKTGKLGLNEPLKCKFNGHVFELNNTSGGTNSNEVFEGEFEPHSFVHGFTLIGPEKGVWTIERVDMQYDSDGEVWHVAFGPAELDETNELNLWRDKSLESFDV